VVGAQPTCGGPDGGRDAARDPHASERLGKNLAALSGRLHCPIPLDRLPGVGTFALEPSRCGPLTYTLDGMYMHSRYDPVGEARELFSAHAARAARARSAAPGGGESAFVFGWGPDYFLRELCGELAAMQRVVVFPMHPGLFLETLRHFEYGAILDRAPVGIVLADLGMLAELLRREVSPVVISHPPSLRTASPELAPLRDLLEAQLYADFHAMYWERARPLLQENLATNWPLIGSCPGVGELFGRFEGGDAIVVGAGPSLTADIPKLGRAWEHSVVVAVDAAYKPLVDAGIRPHFTLTVDPYPDIPQCFAGLAHDGELVFSPMIDPAVLTTWTGARRVTFLSVDGALAPEQARKGVLFAGGSVMHPAVDLAVQMGCGRVTLAGADFGYSDGWSHAGGVVFRKHVGKLASRRPVPGTRGADLASSKNLIAYLRELERYIAAHPDVEWSNATSNGALIGGCAIR
jgi:hypothetical protein